MANLFEQKYSKQTRTITGLINFVFPDDVVILCNTTAGAVALNLLEIPANVWSTQSKLYIVDIGGNASVNNITINAPVGFKVNGQASFVINNNGASLVVAPVSNTNYIGQYSAGGSGSGYNTIQDEGVALPQRTTINFVGGGVTASDVGGKTQVSVTGGIISITNAGMLALINSNSVVPSQQYLITDAQFTDGGALVMGVSSNAISEDGAGYYFNADYQNVGNYTGVAGFVSQIGIWYSGFGGVVNIGDVVLWDNIHYKNLTGNYGTLPQSPDLNPIDWQPLTKSATTGYIFEVGIIKYNVTLNQVYYRADNRGNEVEYSIKKFKNSLLVYPWGRTDYVGNKVFSDSLFLCCNSYVPVCSYNNIIDGSSAEIKNLQANSNGQIIRNTLQNLSSLVLTDYYGQCNDNFLSRSTLQIEFTDTKILVEGNSITSQSNISLTNVTGDSFIKYNNLDNNSSIFNVGTNTDILFQYNQITNKSLITGNNFNGGEFSYCSISGSTTISLFSVVFSWSHQNSTINRTFSNFRYGLDFATAFSLGILTIPLEFEYIGIWQITNGLPAVPVSKISNASGNYGQFPVRFELKDGTSVNFEHTLVGASVTDNMCCDAPFSTNLITGRTNGNDFIEYERSGDFWIRTNLVLLA